MSENNTLTLSPAPAITKASQAARPLPRWLRTAGLLLALGGMLAWLYSEYREPIHILAGWTPILLERFGLNIVMGFTAIALATLLGTLLGALQCAPNQRVARPARIVTQVLRNSPWLVAVFYIMYLVPYEIVVNGQYFFLSDWLKASIGIALPASGYMSEIVRGGIRAVPATQWEAASALGLDRRQSLRKVILPQALRSMVPPWVTLYCVVTLSTSLANLLGVEEMMTTLDVLLAGQTRVDLLLPSHAYTFLLFFFYIYPISRYSRHLEKKWGVKS